MKRALHWSACIWAGVVYVGFAHAGELHREVMLRYGVISDQDTISAFPRTKLFAAAYRHQLDLLTLQLEVGGIFDPSTGSRNSAFINLSQGLDVRLSALTLYYLPGVTFITGPDRYLTTFYQFSHDLGLALRDERGVSLHFSYRHFSNAGIELPNPGRNFLIFSVSLPAGKLGL